MNHRTLTSLPVGRVSAEQGGLCAAEHVMRAPGRSIMAASFFVDLGELAQKRIEIAALPHYGACPNVSVATVG
jgi:hypothetical protein